MIIMIRKVTKMYIKQIKSLKFKKNLDQIHLLMTLVILKMKKAILKIKKKIIRMKLMKFLREKF